MDYFKAIIFGAIQGITEFLPVSSSGHLVILHKYINLPMVNEMAFDVMLHFGTLLAILIFFRKDVWSLIIGWLKTFRGEKNDYGRLAWLIALGTIPAGLIGLFFEDMVESVLRSPLVVAFMLVLVGVVFIIIEKYSKQTGELMNLSWKKSLLIGFGQALALIPGTSRSGITIIAGMSTDLKREEAVRFSFFLSIPIILGAVIKKAPEILEANMSQGETMILVTAFASTLFFGILTIKYFLLFVKKYSLKFFAYYRFALAAVLLLYIFIFQ